MISRLCLLLVPLSLFFGAYVLLANGDLGRLPILIRPGLRIVSIQSFPYDKKDPLGIRPGSREAVDVMTARNNGTWILFQLRLSDVLPVPPSGVALDKPTPSSFFILYVKTNRPMNGEDEHTRLKEKVEEILNAKETVLSYHEDQSPPSKWTQYRAPTPEDKFDLKIPPHAGIVTVSALTQLVGSAIKLIGFLTISIFCLAGYFPIIKGIVKLFKRRTNGPS